MGDEKGISCVGIKPVHTYIQMLKEVGVGLQIEVSVPALVPQ